MNQQIKLILLMFLFLQIHSQGSCPSVGFTFNNPTCYCQSIISGVVSRTYAYPHRFVAETGPRDDFIINFFPRQFCNDPKIMLSLTGFELDNNRDHNLLVSVALSNKAGIRIKVSTSSVTVVRRVDISYIAFA